MNVVYESVSKTTFEKRLNCLKQRGCMVLYGQASGPVAPVDPQTLDAKGSLFLTRTTLGHHTHDREEPLGRANDLFKWLTSDVLHVRIDRHVPLADAAEAHRYLEGRKSKGKILLLP